MVTNINHQELLDLRNKVVDEMLKNFEAWDGGIETGIKIIESNQAEIEIIETLNLQLSRFSAAQDDNYINKIRQIMTNQTRMNETIKNEQKILLENMQQLNKKDQVIKSYISINKKPIFIDKDVR